MRRFTKYHILLGIGLSLVSTSLHAETLNGPPGLLTVIADTFSPKSWTASDDYSWASYDTGKPIYKHLKSGDEFRPSHYFPSPWSGYKDMKVQIDEIGDLDKVSVFTTKEKANGESNSIYPKKCEQKKWGCVSFMIMLPSNDMKKYLRPWIERYLNDVMTAHSLVQASKETKRVIDKANLILSYPN